MKLIGVMDLALEGVKAIRFGRFRDERGYFAETWRRSDFARLPELAFLHGREFDQANESSSRPGTIRGLHLQWNPYMGKLVRTLSGRMVDLVADLRKQGVAVLFISSELEEVVRDCQRVIVLRDRKKLGELEGDAIDEHNIMSMIAGVE